MILTNKYNLPEPIFEAIKNDPYCDGGADISVTRLISSPRIVQLSQRHKDKIGIEVSSRLWATYGQLMHLLLERAVKNNPLLSERYLTENRLFMDYEGWKISGQFDLYDKKEDLLYDYKFVGAYAVKTAATEGKKEWECQLNLLRLMFYKTHGLLPKKIGITGLVRDWTVRNEKEGILPVSTIWFPAWPVYEAEEYLAERVRIHREAEKMADKDLPMCSDEEKWVRSGKPIRCLSYCDARSTCDFASGLNYKED